MSIRMINVKEGECDDNPDSDYPCELEKGWTNLYLAVDLWNLVDPKRASQLLDFIKNEIEKTNEEGRTIITPLVAQSLVEKLSGLDQALLAIADKDYRLREDILEKVLAQDPLLVDSWSEDGTTIYTLVNYLQDVRVVRGFIKRAITLGREIEFD
jgi:hypothetical protein